MATVLNQVTDYLDRRGWRYHAEPERSHILTRVVAQHVEQFRIVIQLNDEGRILSLVAPQLMMVKDHAHKTAVLRSLLAIASEVKFLRWEYDPMDGEIRARIGLLLEDAPLTERQFNRALEALIQIVDEMAMPRLKEVLATGIDPGREGVQASVMEMVQRLQEVLATGIDPGREGVQASVMEMVQRLQELIPVEDRAALPAELARLIADETEDQG